MTLVTRGTYASMDVSTAAFAPQITGLIAGEALDRAAPCYIKTSDGKVYMTNATADNEAAEVVGFTPRACAAGEPITLFGAGARFGYGSSLTPGNVLYAGATAGRLDTAPTVGDRIGVAEVLTSTDIRITRTRARGTIPGVSLAASAIKSAVVAGGAAGNITVTGIAVGDDLIAVVRLDRDATAANINISSLLSEFSITAADTINNTGGTNTTGDALLVLYVDRT